MSPSDSPNHPFSILYHSESSNLPQTSNWSGTFFAVSYSKPALRAYCLNIYPVPYDQFGCKGLETYWSTLIKPLEQLQPKPFFHPHHYLKLNQIKFYESADLGLDRTGYMSFLIGQDWTPKFAGQLLPDRTESGLMFLNILPTKYG